VQAGPAFRALIAANDIIVLRQMISDTSRSPIRARIAFIILLSGSPVSKRVIASSRSIYSVAVSKTAPHVSRIS
jgi:hypothetical protein